MTRQVNLWCGNFLLTCLWLVLYIQWNSNNLNSLISNSLLFRTQNHFPRIFPSVICYQVVWTPAILNNFSFPLWVQNSTVQLHWWNALAGLPQVCKWSGKNIFKVRKKAWNFILCHSWKIDIFEEKSKEFYMAAWFDTIEGWNKHFGVTVILTKQYYPLMKKENLLKFIILNKWLERMAVSSEARSHYWIWHSVFIWSGKIMFFNFYWEILHTSRDVSKLQTRNSYMTYF